MVRIAIAVFLSAVVQMTWGFVFWAVFPFSQTMVQELPDEGRVMTALRETVKESGHYFVPHPGRMTSDETAFMEEHRRGPLVEIIYQKNGVEPMDPRQFGAGFGMFLVSSLLMAVLLVWALPRLETYPARVGYMMLVAIFGVVAMRLGDPIWFHHPWTFALKHALFEVGGWTLSALVMGMVIRPAR